MAVFSVSVYSGTQQDNIGDALNLLETEIETVETGSTIRLVGIADVGPGKYFIPYLIRDT